MGPELENDWIEPLPEDDIPGEELAWYEVWIRVFTSPSETTFREIVRDPQATFGRGALWIFVTATISVLVSVLIIALGFGSQFQDLAQEQNIFGYILVGMIVASPLLGLFSVLGLAINAALYQLIARLMVGEGTFTEMFYALAAIVAPVSLITVLTSFIPIVNLINILVGFYALFLQALAIKAVNHFGWLSAIITIIILPLLIGILWCCAVFFLASAIEPMMGDIFSNIMLTPMP